MTSPFILAVRDAHVCAHRAGTNFFDGLRSLGLTNFELQVKPDGSLPNLGAGAPWSLAKSADVAAFKARLEAENVGVAALMLDTDFCGPDAEKHVQWTIEMSQRARDLGVTTIRLDPLTANREMPAAAIRDTLVRQLTRILARTEIVNFGLENHGVVGNDADFLDQIFAAADPRLGMTLDIANFYWSGLPLHEVYATLEHFAPRAKHSHVKSIAFPAALRETRREAGYRYAEYAAPINEGDIDLKRVVKILREADYAGALCIENEALPRFVPAQRAQVLRREVTALQNALAA